MIKVRLIILAIGLAGLLSTKSFGQGCSDAGVCTINSFKPNSNDSSKVLNNQFKVGVYAGKAFNSILAYGNYFEYNRQLNNSFGVDVKITSLGQTGNNISTFGISDAYLNANYRANKNLSFTLGTKLPLSDANTMKDGLVLPMDYQSSLGTIDLIFGLGYTINKLQFVLAIQQPLTQNNNTFLASNYPAHSKLSTFVSTNKFIRSGDVLFRVSYPFTINEKLNLTASILPIYHLTTDKYTNAENVEMEIKNSEGLTLNANVYLNYTLSPISNLQFNIGAPFIVRESRPDGLTRSLIANLEYSIRF